MRDAHVFLTGATGGLGREILRSLQRMSSVRAVTALARPLKGEDIETRGEELRRYVSGARPFEVVCGDVTRPGLGLDRDTTARLESSVTHVIHAAARIRLDAPLAEARVTNVGGTWEVLTFAERCARLERVAHIGTAFVCGDRQGRIGEDELDEGQISRNSYERSKLEAETLARLWGRGGGPLTILRPGIIVGAAEDGRTSCFRSFYLPLRRLLSTHARRIAGDGEAPLDLVPVDHAAEIIVRLALAPRAEGRTYHVTAGRNNVVTAQAFLAEAFRHWGRPTEEPRFGAEGDARINRLSTHLAYLSGRRWFDDTNLLRDLPSVAGRRPHPFEYLPRLLAFCRRTAWGRRLPWRPGGGLRCAS